MRTLINIELYKIFKRPRTYIAFAAITALIVMIQFGLKVDGKTYVDFMLNDLGSTLEIDGNIMNGYLVCYVMLQLLLVHVPLLIALIAADMISGEANMGTLRVLLSKPYSRTQFMLAKFIASTIYTLLLLVWLAFLALFVSMWIFGTDDMFLMKSSYVVLLKENDVFWRYIGAFGFAALAMTTVAALGFFLSVFAENSIGPIVATMSVIIFFTILSTMNIPVFNLVKPYLFTTHMIGWKEFFDIQVTDTNEAIVGSIQYPERIINSSIVLLIHIILFVVAAIVVFRKKDVLS
ncbi:MAG: ABC transporter permease subunit [Sediminibacterium sp. Gen4]|jgi:ABC-2 type transport system permease protein|uniref:ABC transporter permease n=1 Tax=unclassified Sediminibacterium TaxID=2635961 RepID=UPI0015C0678C|nr:MULTISPECIES: ABC transporter permease subunit [unclassified Sediminibacterium]MBW0161034.1 ABC transporter permease [Sediminibacterium sp.]MBW0165587.1 ABC transporter permease [Sediminibacterium sp.]NWK64918.1 ABC transporter permease subunit [Sediminibacterium sp. Gen4]